MAVVTALLASIAVALTTGGCGDEWATHRTTSSWGPSPQKVGKLACTARVEGTELILSTTDGPRKFVPGVNIGSTIPGHQPGELAVTAADYRRWLRQIGSLDLRAVRV